MPPTNDKIGLDGFFRAGGVSTDRQTDEQENSGNVIKITMDDEEG